jgi:L-rhamnose mutarotase
MNSRYYFALDLKDDPALIAEYESHHRAVWPEVIAAIRDSGIVDMQIFRVRNRLFMAMEVNENFNPATKAAADAVNSAVQAWEDLMWKFQQPLPGSKPGAKWIPMDIIFDLKDC